MAISIKQRKSKYVRFNNIAEFLQVTLVELSKPSLSLLKVLLSVGSSAIGLENLQDGLASSEGVQARMDGIMFQESEGSSLADPIVSLLKDCLSSL